MEIRYHVYADSGLPHIFGHGVVEEEVEQVLRSPAENRAGEERSRVVIGQTAGGPYLKVIYVPDPTPGSVFVITAFPIAGNTLRAFRRRQRRRRR